MLPVFVSQHGDIRPQGIESCGMRSSPSYGTGTSQPRPTLSSSHTTPQEGAMQRSRRLMPSEMLMLRGGAGRPGRQSDEPARHSTECVQTSPFSDCVRGT